MIDFRIKQLFFDRSAVINAVDRATRSVLSKFGAFVRTAVRSSLRQSKKTSDPGNPPRSHTRLLKDNVFFGYDAARQSVVIGPALVGAKGRAVSGTIPQTLEEGGVVTLFARGRPRQVTIEPRPYMSPAFAKELPKLPAMWANSVKP